MIDLLVKYQNFPALEIQLVDQPLAKQYKELICQNITKPAIFRDPLLYTENYFRTLCQQAHDHLGWDWVRPKYTLDVTTVLHKDIETFLAQGFANTPEEYDQLLHELHYALHALQGKNFRGDWLQIEWFNDDSIPMPNDFLFTTVLKFGDVKLQNPYVGHDPSFVYRQRDSSNIAQTCKFHDLVRPGLNIMINDLSFTPPLHYLEWFYTHAKEWVNCHGKDTIMRYTGWPCIGHVVNLNILHDISQSKVLHFESIQVL